MTLKLNRPPKVTNVLVFQDHFTKHIMAYVTPNWTAKTDAKFLYQGYILIFRAPVRLLSDQGANFMSNIIDEMCKLLSVRKLSTMPYHPQTIGLLERSHQTIMWMIGKLGEDKKANWPGHLVEIVHAYNANWSAMMGYSTHYIMFGCRPRLLVDFYFPTFWSADVPKRGALPGMLTNTWLLSVTNWGPLSKKFRPSQWQKWYYSWKIGAMDLKPGDLVLVKADAFQGKRKIKYRWEDKPHEVAVRLQQTSPCTKWWTYVGRHSSYTTTDSSSLCQKLAFPCVWVSTKHGIDVPAPPQSCPLPGGVTVRLDCEKIVVWWSPNIRPARLPWGGSTGSYDFSHGCLLEHPLRMGEDFR